MKTRTVSIAGLIVSILAASPSARAQEASTQTLAAANSPAHTLSLGAMTGGALSTVGPTTEGMGDSHSGSGVTIGYRYEALPQNSSHTFIVLDANAGYTAGASKLFHGSVEAEAAVMPNTYGAASMSAYTLGARVSSPSLETGNAKVFLDLGGVGVATQGSPLYILLTLDLGSIYRPVLDDTEYAAGVRLQIMDKLNALLKIKLTLEDDAMAPQFSSQASAQTPAYRADSTGNYFRGDLAVQAELTEQLGVDVAGSVEDVRQKYDPLNSFGGAGPCEMHSVTGAALAAHATWAF